MYGFSEFTASLNEMEEGMCPTDSRFRTDQRLMENADFDAANKDKVRFADVQLIYTVEPLLKDAPEITVLRTLCCVPNIMLS